MSNTNPDPQSTSHTVSTPVSKTPVTSQSPITPPEATVAGTDNSPTPTGKATTGQAPASSQSSSPAPIVSPTKGKTAFEGLKCVLQQDVQTFFLNQAQKQQRQEQRARQQQEQQEKQELQKVIQKLKREQEKDDSAIGRLSQFWKWTGFGEKRLWDFLQLLIVPTILAVGGFYLQEQAKIRDQAQQEAAKQRDQQLADDRSRQETLNRYLDQMSELMINKGLRKAQSDSEVFVLAQSRTTTALRGLDKERRQLLTAFLRSADLLNPKGREGILQGAYLDGADLQGARLFSANLQGADLIGANLQRAVLLEANLPGANLFQANLQGADLFRANLQKAVLSGANLQRANLAFADLSTAYSLTNTQLSQAAYLCHTKLPKGVKLNPNRDCYKLGISPPFFSLPYPLHS